MIHLSEKKIAQAKEILDSARSPEERRFLLMDVLQLNTFISKRKNFMVGDVPIHCELYESAKDDPVIVFLPGIGTYSEMYCEFLSKLSSWGFNVVGVDLRGHGYSGGERGAYTVDQVVSDMAKVVDVLVETLNPRIGFFGCSIGSPLARACAENDPRIRALLCHTLFLSEFPPDLITFSGWNMLHMSRLFMPGFKIDFRSFIDVNALLDGNAFANFIDYDPLIVWEYSINTLSDIYSATSRLVHEKMDFNAAIITGENDEVISADYMRLLVEKMEHPFDFIQIPKARHMLPFLHVKDTVMAARDWFRKNL
ncbi:MAG: lysophospholipase [Proteobacteria bacterium]|nr:lysophospholipase [Pseudomonadota bacterium]